MRDQCRAARDPRSRHLMTTSSEPVTEGSRPLAPDVDVLVVGERVVITSAGRGLGSLLAHTFSRAGAWVALVARTEKELKAVAEELPGPTLMVSGDVTDEDFNEAVADAAVAEWGGLDVWIANAGISPIVAGPARRPRRSGGGCWM